MKKISLLLFILFIAFYGHTQTPIVITPGVGVGKLKLGMSEKQAEDILKGEITWSGYKDQVKSFVEYDVRIDSVMQFVQGFDSCGRYNGDLPESMPVFGLYFKKHKLMFITITSYSASDEQLGLIKISNGLTFFDSMEDCMKKMGKEYIPVSYGDYTGDHYYYKKGIEMVYDEGVLRSIGIYPVVPAFKQMIADRKKKLDEDARLYGTSDDEEDENDD